MSQTCPSCHAAVPAGETICLECGTELVFVSQDALPAPLAPEHAGAAGDTADDAAHAHPEPATDDAEAGASAAEPAIEAPCPDCGERVSPDANGLCPVCGFDFSSSVDIDEDEFFKPPPSLDDAMAAERDRVEQLARMPAPGARPSGSPPSVDGSASPASGVAPREFGAGAQGVRSPSTHTHEGDLGRGATAAPPLGGPPAAGPRTHTSLPTTHPSAQTSARVPQQPSVPPQPAGAHPYAGAGAYSTQDAYGAPAHGYGGAPPAYGGHAAGYGAPPQHARGPMPLPSERSRVRYSSDSGAHGAVGTVAAWIFVDGQQSVFFDGRMTSQLRLDVDELLIGRRDPAAGHYPDIDLAHFRHIDGHISRRHARLKRRAGQWYLEDLCDNDATFLNDQAHVLNREEATLSDGDRIMISDSVSLTFRMMRG